MPWSKDIREEALVRSGRHCCICHIFAGRDAVVHHIVQDADGGPNELDNAIVLCSRCHGEAGHYNPRHPLGTKYSPTELRRHRDEWWAYRASGYHADHSPESYEEPLESGRGGSIWSKEVGVLWSRRADIPVAKETIKFEGQLLAEDRCENAAGVRWEELFVRPDGTFLVYVEHNHRCDWGDAYLDGSPPDFARLRAEDLQERYPSLASAAGLQRVRRL